MAEGDQVGHHHNIGDQAGHHRNIGDQVGHHHNIGDQAGHHHNIGEQASHHRNLGNWITLHRTTILLALPWFRNSFPNPRKAEQKDICKRYSQDKEMIKLG